jgi:hypothetical protein
LRGSERSRIFTVSEALSDDKEVTLSRRQIQELGNQMEREPMSKTGVEWGGRGVEWGGRGNGMRGNGMRGNGMRGNGMRGNGMR